MASAVAKHGVWLAIALLGALSLGVVATARGETISALWVLAASVSVYLIAYRYYSRYIAGRVLGIDPRRTTPAHVRNDGLDYVPTNRYVLFGHHFAAIAGAGPLVGPVLAAQMGYLPGMLWILFGVVLAGAVQDFIILFISMRRDGRSLGELVRMEMGSAAGVVALFGAFVIVGAGNAVNLTDGLDGLAIVPVMIAAASFGAISYLVGNGVFANYLQINFVPGTGELVVILGAVIGAGLGFLWFNAPPAAIFMGDTGSLALGGLIGSVAVATKHEIVMVIIGGLFVMETLSVIIQVGFFKLTGRRVFLMAPIHHHFEKLGWTESQVVVRFWIIAVGLALLGLSTLKLR